MNYKLRQAVIGDSQVIRRLVREARLNPFGLDWRRFTVAATSQEGIIGCGQVKSHRGGSRELASIVVAPEWRDEGVSKGIINHLLSIHPLPIYLTCRSGMGEFYEKFGFKIINNDMPPYFKRVSWLVSLLKIAAPKRETLLVMKIQ